jgi:hypothetical protein
VVHATRGEGDNKQKTIRYPSRLIIATFPVVRWWNWGIACHSIRTVIKVLRQRISLVYKSGFSAAFARYFVDARSIGVNPAAILDVDLHYHVATALLNCGWLLLTTNFVLS